jgi:hypothetical protein
MFKSRRAPDVHFLRNSLRAAVHLKRASPSLVDPNLRVRTVIENLDQPTSMAFLGYSDPEFSWKFEVAPAGHWLHERPRDRSAVRRRPLRGCGPDHAPGRTLVPLQSHRQPS